MQTQISPALQALLQTAQMVTPEQGPTVAKQVAQAAMQKMQAAPPGIEALLPGVQQQAAQSAQAAQPATQGDVNQLRQMMSQMAPQGQGISAGADVRMAEGGIVGYAGPEGSDVELDVSGRIKKALRDWYERTERGYMERAGATPEMIAQKLGSEAPVAAPVVERPRGQENYEPAPQLTVGNAPPVAPEAQRLMDRQRAPAPLPSGVERKQPAAETGIATLMGPAVPTGSERQFGEAMTAAGRIEIPQERTPQQFRQQTEDYYRSLGIDPDFAKQRMARLEAQERRDQEEAAARAKMVEGRGIENLISRLSRFGGAGSLFRGAAQAQQGMEPIIAAQRAGDERFAALMRERQIAADKERSAIEDMQRALADGDIARAEKSRNDALAARNAKNELEAKARAQYAPQLLQAETADKDRTSRERDAAAGRENQVLVAKLQLSKPSDLQERIALLAKNPEQFKRIYGDKTAVDLAELRAKLLADYSKNAMQLTAQGIKSFDDYLALYGQTTMAPGSTSTPPPGAVREKGKQ
jgi:hypothetical protein